MRKLVAALAVLSAWAYPLGAYASEAKLLQRIETLETKIENLETVNTHSDTKTTLGLAAFNPYITVVLNGTYRYWGHKPEEMQGFQIGEEGTTPNRGFSLGESEINLGASVDDKFMANLTVAIVNEDGEDKIELEEAFFKTVGLPWGLTVMAGRLKPVFGYLNEKHTHTDDFADRPLPYRAFLNNAYKDDGIQASMVLPIDFYMEIGGGIYQGNYFPAGGNDNAAFGASNAYLRFGGDITTNQSWLLGLSYLYAKSAGEGRETEDLVFDGIDHLYDLSLKYTWAPTGNNRYTELSLQGEYLFRNENGKYAPGDESPVKNDKNVAGWYLQATYKFKQNWRVGYRYARIQTRHVPTLLEDTVLDTNRNYLDTHAVMAEWNNTEFSRIRLQYNYDRIARRDNHGILVEYTITFGAHPAHAY